MLLRPNSDTVTGTIIAPDGTVANRPTIVLSQEEAELLRKYKKFLAARGLREALYCNHCWSGNLADGVSEAYVTNQQIVIKCNHRLLFYQGQTF